MAESGAAPKDYGLKVQSHPVLMVTSPLKMRSAQPLLLSYSGSLVQTVAMHKDAARLRSNLIATDRLISSMGAPTTRGPIRERDSTNDEWRRSFLWENVGAEAVLDFMAVYSTPAKAFRANSAVICDFVKKMNQVGQLSSWTVALLAEGQGRKPYTFPCGLALETLPMRTDSGVEGTYSIGVLTDPADEAIDMSRTEWTCALKMTLADWKPDPARNRVSPPKRPSGLKIRDVRGFGCTGVAPAPERGLLLLYPLAPEGAGADVLAYWKDPIMAFAISFPSSKTGVKVEYRVDHLLWETEYGPSD